MKDLYKRLNLFPGADERVIRAQIEQCDDPALRQVARHVLLDWQRKRIYDRNRKIMRMIGQLRSNLGLLEAPFWQQADCTDFNCPKRKVDIQPMTMHPTEKTTAAHQRTPTIDSDSQQPSHSNFQLWLAIIAMVLAGGVAILGVYASLFWFG